MLYEILARFRFAAAALARYKYALGLLCARHFAKALLGRRVNVWRQFRPHIVAFKIQVGYFFAVYRERLERIHGYQNIANIGLKISTYNIIFFLNILLFPNVIFF